MPRYMILDLETENHESFKRTANPFDERNYIVARGWKYQGDPCCSWQYFNSKEEVTETEIPDDIVIIAGHNIKFDLLYSWKEETLRNYFKRGGKIWCTQYAEYLLNGQTEDSHMVPMDGIVEKYGGRKKIDVVKLQWEQGILTSRIDKDLLIDYLVGTEEEKRNSGDIGNTEKIFLGQYKKAKELGMLPMIMARMDGLLATTDMEFNGLKIDVQEAKKKTAELTLELRNVEKKLNEFIPELPPELEFNWASRTHVSCLIFGGTVKYRKQLPYIDEKTGEYARKLEKQEWWYKNGKLVNPAEIKKSEADRFLSGKKKGEIKTKVVTVKGELKTKYHDLHFEFPGYTDPKQEWEMTTTDALGGPLYSTSSDIIEELGARNLPFLKLLARRNNITKDLGTYYLVKDGKRGYKGMLVCVMPESHIIHHNLNHVNTVTTRLSSNNPNLQNIPKSDTSDVKKMFISRFGDAGKMVEADYSQLEVVIQGMLSGDKQLIADLNAKVDFHCKRVSAWKNCTYEEAVARCKNEEYEDYKTWKGYRNDAKVFSFQRAYGAGAAKISLTTGMKIEDVQALIEAEEALYPGITAFNAAVEEQVRASAIPFRDPSRDYKVFRRGQYIAPTGTRYTFRTYEAQDWQRKRGIEDSFMPTELKNYPVQGTGGEVVQIIIGRLWRNIFLPTDNFGEKAFLCNTVHDSVWIDVHDDVLKELYKPVKDTMESVPEALNELYGMNVPVKFPVELEAGENLFTKHLLHY